MLPHKHTEFMESIGYYKDGLDTFYNHELDDTIRVKNADTHKDIVAKIYRGATDMGILAGKRQKLNEIKSLLEIPVTN